MYKAVLFIFILGLACYIPFTRTPDYFDSRTVDGRTKTEMDSSNKKMATFVYFMDAGDKVVPFRFKSEKSYPNNSKVKVIYDSADPKRASIYALWGYWIDWPELIAIIVGYFVLLEGAKAITHHPHPDAIKELEEEERKPKIRRPRYNDNSF